MSDFEPDLYQPATRAVRAGQERSDQGENSEALYLSSSFVFKDAAEAAARFAGDEDGNIYSRFTNPTVRMFEHRLAALEGGERCLATASGMSAILSTCLGLLRAGDHVVCSNSVFGTTVGLFNNILSKFDVETTFVPLRDAGAWETGHTPQHAPVVPGVTVQSPDRTGRHRAVVDTCQAQWLSAGGGQLFLYSGATATL